MHEDLPWDHHLKIRNQVIEGLSIKSQAKQVGEHITALRECVKEWDLVASAFGDGPEDGGAPQHCGEDTTPC